MGKIFVVGLGPGSIDTLTMGAIKRIKSGKKNFLRTEKHPTIEYFRQENVPYTSFDYIYDNEEDFDKVYNAIVNKLKYESEMEDEVNYYVPGNPLVAERTVELLLREDLDIEIISGMSFIEPLIEVVGRDPVNGLKIVDGAVFDNLMIDINSDMIITQVYNLRILSEVKILLSEVYGDEYYIWLVHGAGIREVEKVLHIPLYQLDRFDQIGYLTSIYVPKTEKNTKNIYDFSDIMGIMRLLRSKDGCPWDIEQTHESIRQSVIEEAYEVVDAIDSGDIDSIVEELGDLLLQVVFHGQIGYEEGEFHPMDITSNLAKKLIYRHPHIFLEKKVDNSNEVVYNWNKLKYEKRQITTLTDKIKNLPKLPALMSSFKIQEKAAEIGFDWDNIQGPINKVNEEFKEVLEAMEKYGGGDKEVEGELGDLLFAVVNLSRFLGVNPEVALNRTINKFVERFEFMEKKSIEQGKDLEEMTLEDMDILWNMAKENKQRDL